MLSTHGSDGMMRTRVTLGSQQHHAAGSAHAAMSSVALLNATAALVYPEAGFQSAAGEPVAADISVAGAGFSTSVEQ